MNSSEFDLDLQLQTALDLLVEPESQVTIHCTASGPPLMTKIRAWSSTYLVDEKLGHSSQLIHTAGIVLAPDWQMIPSSGKVKFTLIFSGLPKSCKSFNLMEIIDEPGGWFVKNIKRNKLDVYHINL